MNPCFILFFWGQIPVFVSSGSNPRPAPGSRVITKRDKLHAHFSFESSPRLYYLRLGADNALRLYRARHPTLRAILDPFV